MAIRSRYIAVAVAVALLLAAAHHTYLVSLDEPVDVSDLAHEDAIIEDESAKDGQTHEDLKTDNSTIVDEQVGNIGNGDLVGVATVEFPNGAAVDINLLHYFPEEPTVPVDGPLADSYNGLAMAAERGDGAAGRWLYRALRSCIGGFTDEALMEASIADLRNTGTIRYPDGNVENVGHGPQAIGTEEVIREQFQKCRG